MTPFRYALLADGSSDAALLPILHWLLCQHLPGIVPFGTVVDYTQADRPKGLVGRIGYAIERHPCKLLFVHRDAEGQPAETRYAEVTTAIDELGDAATVPHVCVVPVRMSEAWLLISRDAIRDAVGNPTGRVRLTLPTAKQIESVADPKTLLYELLLTASEQTGRKRAKLHPPSLVRRVVESITDFTPLRRLPAFQRLEADVAAFAATWPPIDE